MEKFDNTWSQLVQAINHIERIFQVYFNNFEKKTLFLKLLMLIP